MIKNVGFRTPEKVEGRPNHDQEVFKSGGKKPLRYSHDSFTRDLIGKHIKLKTTSNEIFDGNLMEIGMFDILLVVKATETYDVGGKSIIRDSTRKIILLKGQIVWVEVV